YDDFCSKESFYREEYARAHEAGDTYTMAQVGIWYDELVGVNPTAVREQQRQRALAEQVMNGLVLPEQLALEDSPEQA
ncbi:MAG TPA: hypothetical protein VG992_04730, partial [Candidatus Saccharimonadales bacterium]|nr:hypothetical protein [Candidatus Saccharimonadales bacterium]